MESPKLKKHGACAGLFLLQRLGRATTEAAQGGLEANQHGHTLPSLPCSLARPRAITQACSASGRVCFKPIRRETNSSL